MSTSTKTIDEITQDLPFYVYAISCKPTPKIGASIIEAKDALKTLNQESPSFVKDALEQRIVELSDKYNAHVTEEKHELKMLTHSNSHHGANIAVQAVVDSFKDKKQGCLNGIENVVNFASTLQHNLKEFSENLVGKSGLKI